MNDSARLTLRRTLVVLALAVVTVLVGDYLYHGARKAQTEARLAEVRAITEMWPDRAGDDIAVCRLRGSELEWCIERAYEAEHRRAEAEQAASKRRYAMRSGAEDVPEEDVHGSLRQMAEGEPPPRENPSRLPSLSRRLRIMATVTPEEWNGAKHEAAHAVVAVRLGLPLGSTDIIKRQQVLGAGGDTINSQGYTTLREGTVRPWLEALPDAEARRNLEAFAAQGAAGIVAERDLGSTDDHPVIQEDLTAVIGVARWLGLGSDRSELPVRRFIAQATTRAEEALREDDGAAWERVAEALAERRSLSGDEVRRLVSEEGSKAR